MSTPRATNLAPSFSIVRRSPSPRSSIEVTSLKSTTCDGWPDRHCSHIERNCVTHGPVSWPQSVHRASGALSSQLILSIFAYSLSLSKKAHGWPPYFVDNQHHPLVCRTHGHQHVPSSWHLKHTRPKSLCDKSPLNPAMAGGAFRCRDKPRQLWRGQSPTLHADVWPGWMKISGSRRSAKNRACCSARRAAFARGKSAANCAKRASRSDRP